MFLFKCLFVSFIHSFWRCCFSSNCPPRSKPTIFSAENRYRLVFMLASNFSTNSQKISKKKHTNTNHTTQQQRQRQQPKTIAKITFTIDLTVPLVFICFCSLVLAFFRVSRLPFAFCMNYYYVCMQVFLFLGVYFSAPFVFFSSPITIIINACAFFSCCFEVNQT